MKKIILSSAIVLMSVAGVFAQRGDRDQQRADMKAKWESMTPAERDAARAKMDSVRKARGGNQWGGRGDRGQRPDSLRRSSDNNGQRQNAVADSVKRTNNGGFNRKKKTMDNNN